MGKDAEQSHRGWRRHLRGVSRHRATEPSGNAKTGTLFFSAKELGILAVNFLEWGLYLVLTMGLVYLMVTDQLPKLVRTDAPTYWIGTQSQPASQPVPAGPVTDLKACAMIAEETVPLDSDLSPEFKRGFEAAIQVMLGKFEGRIQ